MLAFGMSLGRSSPCSAGGAAEEWGELAELQSWSGRGWLWLEVFLMGVRVSWVAEEAVLLQ